MAKAFQSKGANFFVWILIGLLILGLAGFGIGSFTGSFNSVGSVGDEDIPVNDYWRELQNELRNLSSQAGRNVPLEEGLDYGVGRVALQRLVVEAALDNEASRIGLSTGDENVLKELRQTPGFLGLDGEFDQSQYEFVLERSGWTAADYDEIVREQSARSILQSAVSGALRPSEGYVERIVRYYFESRDFSWARIDSSLLTDDLPEPTNADLTAYHAANPEEFTLPETREITFAWVTPEMLVKTIDIDEDTLRVLYEDLSEEYDAPERRFVERMVFPTMEEAAEAKSRLDAGEIDFAALAAERGLSLSDLDLGEITGGTLDQASDAAIFALDDLGVTDPVQSELGPAIYNVNAILLARQVSFDDARPDLVAQAAMDRARRNIADNISNWDDLIAAGATLEELADESELRIGAVSYNALAAHEIVGYEEFRRAADQVTEDDFPELYELSDGGVFALRLNRIVPPIVQPFVQAEEEVRAEWINSELRKKLLELAETFETGMRSGKNFEEFGLAPLQAGDIARGSPVDGTPDGLVAEIFSLEVNEAVVVDDGETIAIARLDAINPADLDSEELSGLVNAIRLQNAAEIGRDAFVLFANEVQNQAGLELDQSVIDAVHVQFQ